MSGRLSVSLVAAFGLLMIHALWPENLSAAPQEAGIAVKTVLDGVFTADQAARGGTAYQKACSGCHGDALQGHAGGYGAGADAPTLVGTGFVNKWREDNLVEMFTTIRTAMPRQAVNSVTEATKLDILMYILQVNGFPDGAAEFASSALGTTILVGKDGPKPLPSETTVTTVGCLTKGADSVWVLNNAAEPLRTRIPDETTPEELKFSEARPLGTLTFKLPNLDRAIPGVKPAPLEGQRVQIKGLMYRQPNNDRITAVRSMKSVASSCAP